MRKSVLVLLAGLSLLLASNVAQADFGGSCNSCNTGGGSCAGKSGFWSRTNKVGYFCSEEEERWQKFWHDYYKALHLFYKKLDKCDWVIYYKYHGYQIGGGAAPQNCAPPVYAPVYVTPTMHWSTAGAGAPCYAPNGGGQGGTPGWCRTCR
ncbi:MAG: hypothetical protein U0796_15915 [Gemmatales bacterium]